MNAEIDLRTTLLSSNRILLRPFQEADKADVSVFMMDEESMNLIGLRPTKNRQDAESLLHHFMESLSVLAIYSKELERVIGFVALPLLSQAKYVASEEKGREVSYLICRDSWGKGLMKEALNLLISHLFSSEKFSFLAASVGKENKRSEKVLLSCRFQYDGNVFVKDSYGNLTLCSYYLLAKKNTMSNPSI